MRHLSFSCGNPTRPAAWWKHCFCITLKTKHTCTAVCDFLNYFYGNSPWGKETLTNHCCKRVKWTYCRWCDLNQNAFHHLTWNRCGAFRPESEQLFKGVVVCPSQVSVPCTVTLLFCQYQSAFCELQMRCCETRHRKMFSNQRWTICPKIITYMY